MLFKAGETVKQLILGTVQLGMDYGINNIQGKPSMKKAFDILSTAYKNGIRILDTAQVYGDSERVIGSFIRNTGKKFKIATKLPKLDETQDMEKQVQESLKSSIENLGVSKIDYYLYHNFDDLISKPQLLEYFKNLKRTCVIEKLGVSIYDVGELEYILDNLYTSIDIVQIPFNIFDLRWLKGDLLKRTKEKGIEIAVRSVFLQGLFFINKDSSFKIHPKTYSYITKLSELANSNNTTIEQIALSFVKQQEYVDYMLVGCEDTTQLIDNISNFNKCVELEKEDLDFINQNFGDIEKKIIDPRQW